MIGVVVLILVVLAVLYFLSVNNKLNLNSLNDSSPSVGQSSDSVQTDPATGQFSVKFNSPRIKSLRILHGDNRISKVCVAERPLAYTEIVDEGNRNVGTNCVFLGTLSDAPPPTERRPTLRSSNSKTHSSCSKIWSATRSKRTTTWCATRARAWCTV
jgi:hypothetical protein